MALRDRFGRVAVIDLDAHHGDGTQEAFYFTDDVFTLSLHCFDAGFYPGTGTSAELGAGRGAGTCLNVPVPEGTAGQDALDLFRDALAAVSSHRPAAVVCVCGADSVQGDPNGRLNIALAEWSAMVALVCQLRVPTLLLGGGGYSSEIAARAWCAATLVALEVDPATVDVSTPPHLVRDRPLLLHGPAAVTRTSLLPQGMRAELQRSCRLVMSRQVGHPLAVASSSDGPSSDDDTSGLVSVCLDSD